MNNTLTFRRLFWGLLSLYFLFITYEVLSSDYLFTDEAWWLWHNRDPQGISATYHAQGRALGGRMVGWLLRRVATVRDMRNIRALSLAECALFVILLSICLKRWQRHLPGLSDSLIYLTVAAAATSLTLAIWTGWAISANMPVAALLSLVAAFLLYEPLQKDGITRRVGTPLLFLIVIILGVVSVFLYQSPFPLFLMPAYLPFLLHRDGKIDRSITRGLLFYTVILALYYVAFRLELRLAHMEPSARTGLATDPLERVGFFFSTPMNQAFNGNFFFDEHSVVSQAVFPALLLAWVLLTWRRMRREGKPATIFIRYLAGMLAFWVLGFLPQLAGHENFAPYRTMLPLTLMALLALGEAVLSLMPPEKRKGLALALVAVFVIKGAYNYRVYLAGPLSEEYRIVKERVRRDYHTGITRVAFVQAPVEGFRPLFGINSFKDEFGLPSANKDWTAETLTKQIVYEMTGRRTEAEALQVSFFGRKVSLSDSAWVRGPGVMVIDMPALLHAEAPAGR